VLEKTNAKYLALGHHADDQVETMLMALTKVIQPEVLSGIPIQRPFNKSVVIRPFLSVNKHMIELYCDEHNLNPRYDESYEDLDYYSKYFRKKVVHLLQQSNPNIYKTAHIMSENLQTDNTYLNEEVKLLFNALMAKQNKIDSFKLDRKTFQNISK